MELVEMSLFTLFFEFVKNKSGLSYNISPLEAARVNIKVQNDPVSIFILNFCCLVGNNLAHHVSLENKTRLPKNSILV
jgi:hypothetical protein